MAKIVNQLSGIWTQLDVALRLTIVVIAVVGIVAAGLLGYHAGRDGGQEASEVMGDTTFPAGQGHLFLDDGGSIRREHMDRAAARGLEAVFREIPGVRAVRVDIHRPAHDPAVPDTASVPRASISVDLDPGSHLSAEQISGMTRCAMTAVAGLSADDIDIRDGDGDPASGSGGSALDEARSTLAAERATETYLSRTAQDLLDATLGPGHSSVKVAVRLDFTRRTDRRSDPTGSVLNKEISSTTQEKTPILVSPVRTTDSIPVPGGHHGTVSGPEASTKSRDGTQNEYTVGNHTVTEEDGVGRIKAMNVSILLDLKSQTIPRPGTQGSPSGVPEVVRVPYTAEEQARFKDLVLNAIGFNAAVGSEVQREVRRAGSAVHAGAPINAGSAAADVATRFTVTVQSMEMWHPASAVVAHAQNAPWLSGWSRPYAVYALMAFVAIIIILAMLVPRLLRTRSRAPGGVDSASMAGDSDGIARGATGSGLGGQVPSVRAQGLKAEVARRVQTDPAAAADILRAWMGEHDA